MLLSAKTTDHLERAEQGIQKAKKLLARQGYTAELRTVVIVGFIRDRAWPS